MKSPGQTWAVKQLKDIELASHGQFEIFSVIESQKEGQALSATVSVSLKKYTKNDNGIPFKIREKIKIDIPWHFPLAIPSVNFSHNDYGAFPHVQWGNHMCLFQAPETEWQPSQGMFGFIERLDSWLEAAAQGQLDPTGMPLHPPAVYPVSNFRLVPREDTPVPNAVYWGGYVVVTRENNVVAELGNWIEHGTDVPDGRLASVILLPGDMPYEYPKTMFDLLMALHERNLPIDTVRLIVELGILRTDKGKPALFLLGSAMRGNSGGQRLQHLTGWIIDAEQADKFRDVIVSATDDNKADIKQFYEWAAKANVEWCRVMEDRPEIVERRDSRSSASFWKGKNVVILGCGAIGSSVANMLVRAGATRFQLFDKDIVTPGILVRQDFRREHIGYTKTSALKINIQKANPETHVDCHHINLITLFGNNDIYNEVMQADVIIDATASMTFGNALEYHFRHSTKRHPPIVTMSIGHNADFGLMTVATESNYGMAVDIDRRSKIAFSNSINGKKFLEEFWPTSEDRRQLFQPEPGCSNPTFRGSFADVLALTSQMTNIAATWLCRENADSVQCTFALNLSENTHFALPARQAHYDWPKYLLLDDRVSGYQVRVEQSALKSMLSWVRQSERVNGKYSETGGVLFGQFDDYLKVIWVDEISGPPPDSVASPSYFICGTLGVKELHDEKRQRTTGSVAFIGMWHTHPFSGPIPSRTDLSAMRSLLENKNDYLGNSFLMIIIGTGLGNSILSANVFERASYDQKQ